MIRTSIVLAAMLLTACGGASARPAEPPHAATAPTTAAPAAPAVRMSTPIDAQQVAAATGAPQTEKGADGTVKASFPRTDVAVAVDGWTMPPFMGLTSWAAFAPAQPGTAEAMVMGDLVLFEDEVNPVMSVLLDGGIAVTALHNHFFFDDPHVYFMHLEGEGTVAKLGAIVRAAIDRTAEIRKKAPRPATSSGARAVPPKSNVDGAKLDAILGVKGQAKDGMYKAVIGRNATAACGCTVGKAMGVSTWAAFAGSDDDAVVDGDFAVTEVELQGVLKSLRGGGIDVVAIHHHMTGEVPRILFLHYWGRGKASVLAATVKKALDLTAVDRST